MPERRVDGLARRQMDGQPDQGSVVAHADRARAELLPVIVDVRDVVQFEPRLLGALAGDLHFDPADVVAALPGRAERLRRVAAQNGAVGVALESVISTEPEVAGDREEPSRNPLDVGTRVPEVFGVGVIGLTDRDDPRLPGFQNAVSDRPPHGVDLVGDVNHVAFLVDWSGDCACRGRSRWPARRGAESRSGGMHRATHRHPAAHARPPHTSGVDLRVEPRRNRCPAALSSAVTLPAE